jgi:hypothetical protein
MMLFPLNVTGNLYTTAKMGKRPRKKAVQRLDGLSMQCPTPRGMQQSREMA